jgi:hypothetical protein
VHRGGVGHVEHLGAECLRVPLEKVADLGGVADGADNAIATFEELFGNLTAEAATDARDQPRTHCHRMSFRRG